MLERPRHDRPGAGTSEWSRYFRPAALRGVEALHANFVSHSYRPHSHPTWTIAAMRRGAAQFTVDEKPHRARAGELFVLEPETVHTGLPGVPEGWDRTVTLAELADAARLSRFELVRCFTAQVGLPPHAFQIDLRINEARGLLRAGEAPAAVAAACGFSDQAHLTRTFKRAVGTTPRRYADAHP
jgi:AraC-like DNA-binding protein